MSKSPVSAVFLVLLFAFSGCASPKYIAKDFLGISSIDGLKDRKTGRFSGNFKLSYPECYDRVLAIVKTLSNDVFVQDKKGHVIGASNFDTVFLQCVDATEAGIFFEEISRSETKVDTVSKNSRLSKFVLEQISAKIYIKPSQKPEPNAAKSQASSVKTK